MAMNVQPNITLCKKAENWGSMNWGRNAAKDKARFGLSRPTKKPPRNSCMLDVGTVDLAGPGVEARSALMPRNTKYDAPASLTMVNAADDTAKITARPREATKRLPKEPRARPPMEARPAPRPWLNVRVMRNRTPGPG